MCTVYSGNYDLTPEEPVARAKYMLEQMRIYLLLHKNDSESQEYKRVTIIYDAMMHLMANDNYKSVCTAFINTSDKLQVLGSHSSVYWNEYVKFVNRL